MNAERQLAKIAQRISGTRTTLLQHPVYHSMQSESDLCLFMQHHVFAVWDFMSLLKGLQHEIAGTGMPWVPRHSPELRRFINEIVIDEESDKMPSGEVMSHFEMYILAMKEAGCDMDTVNSLYQGAVNLYRPGQSAVSVTPLLDSIEIDDRVRQFCAFTFKVISGGKLHEIASAFTFGREDLIPDMFKKLVTDLESRFPGRYSTLIYYLDRHIELDGDTHGPLSHKLVSSLCGDCDVKWQEASDVAQGALEARIGLWSAISDSIDLNAPVRELELKAAQA
eukprot:TRINITY_DN30972_c0_g1_i1.p1 TRINITY_DN30972_c0_g1~~TRINITY_DN30972_c0_g1_i1.p1  ORF type:complete len:280 (+),score=53.28 TRINITY_DN30972_c0_g1_i1:63-902(+)